MVLGRRILALAFFLCVLTGCGGRANRSERDYVVYCQPGETVMECVQELPSNPEVNGTVIFSAGTFPSGYTASRITRSHVTLQGATMPVYNPNLTALTGGTIITGTLPVGADYFTARDLGIDVGPGVVGAAPADGFSMTNVGQVIGAPPFKSPVLENIAVLGINVPGAHSILVENVTEAYIHNIQCRFQTHCLGFKGDGVIDTVDAAGGSTDDVILKSDNYAPAANISLSHVTLGSIVPGDSGGIWLEALDADLAHITILDVVGKNLRYGLHVDAAVPFSVSDVNASGLSFDDSGYLDSATSCLVESGRTPSSQTINDLHISNLTCSSFGHVQNINNQSVQNGTLVNIYGFNILGDAFWNSGNWEMSNITLNTVSGNGVVALGGVTTIKAPSFTNITGDPFLEMGGQIVVGK